MLKNLSVNITEKAVKSTHPPPPQRKVSINEQLFSDDTDQKTSEADARLVRYEKTYGKENVDGFRELVQTKGKDGIGFLDAMKNPVCIAELKHAVESQVFKEEGLKIAQKNRLETLQFIELVGKVFSADSDKAKLDQIFQDPNNLKLVKKANIDGNTKQAFEEASGPDNIDRDSVSTLLFEAAKLAWDDFKTA